MATPPVIFDRPPPLPEDIIFFEIFARLPTKSLLKLRRVSVFCRSLTSNPQFLAAHRRRFPRPRYLLSYSSVWLSLFNYLSPKNPENSEIKAVPCFNYLSNISYVKSINGHMCMVQGNQIVIRNLVRNKEFEVPFHSHSELRKHDCVHHQVYFCYCRKKDKYKLLLSTSIRNRISVLDSVSYSIFTVGVDKEWRVLDHLGLHQLGKSKNICVDGVLYCTNFSTTSEVENGIMATFDVGREKFGFITYPNELSPSRCHKYHLIEVDGNVGIVDLGDLESYVVRIWIRENMDWIENRVLFPSRWENLYDAMHYFSFTTNSYGEIVLACCGTMTSKCRIFVYNMEKKEWRRMEVIGLEMRMICGDFLIEEIHL